jgi:8-oxo-dGTP diphosphatase
VRIHVLAGALVAPDGRVLLAQRPAGKHLAGGWEFPGGKRDRGETRESALARELREELGVELRSARPLIRFTHTYPDRVVDLDVWRVDAWDGQPRGLDGQALAWCRLRELEQQGLLPADRPIVTALRLPPLVAITPADRDPGVLRAWIDAAVGAGAGLVQLRVPGLRPAALAELARILAPGCRRREVRFVVNGVAPVLTSLVREGVIDGLHCPGRRLVELGRLEKSAGFYGASCHDAAELEQAAAAGADYAFLSPVKRTRSHPGRQPLGWERFAEWVAPLRLPVYALGGMTAADLSSAWAAGAQGIAGIRGFGPSGA